MRAKGTKFISLFLMFSLMALTTLITAKEKRGANLIIQKTDGQQVKGELITVKENSLLLLSSEGADISVDVRNIKFIKIVKKSKLLKGAGYGFLILGVPGAIYLTAYPGTDSQRWLYALGGASLGLYSAIIGGIIGAIA
ncbi:unnamed protein product, partial [marine sediment metagenome]